MTCSIFCTGFVLSYFALLSCNGNLQPLEFVSGEAAIRVGDSPTMTAGVLGLSQFIKPIEQINIIHLQYPNSYGNNFGDEVTYAATTLIYFECTEPTRRIAVHANPDWALKYLPAVRIICSNGTSIKLELGETSFNPEEDMLYIDMIDMMVPNTKYEMLFKQQRHPLGTTGRFGLQVYKQQMREDSGDEVITVALSAAPKSMRKMIPCFDNPAIAIPYSWEIRVFYSSLSPAKVMMSGYTSRRNMHSCDSTAEWRSSAFIFKLPKMAIEFTQLRVAPFDWFEETGVSQPPPSCYDNPSTE